ncbi:MAG: four helix bundle protein [Verrucomicrobia bacterium]|nr:four helix bundle protein [Verrucomicrobiota bacterium]
MMRYFDHEKMEVYQTSIKFVGLIDEIVKELPRGRAYLVDQFQRAGLSVSLNIAEGAGEFAVQEKCRFYRMAKRSATECAAILDVCRQLGIIDESNYLRGREFVLTIVAMLIKLAKKSGAGERSRGEAPRCPIGRGKGRGRGA